MLLSINLPGLELSTIRGELPVQPGLPADSTLPVGGFAELLGLRVVTEVPGQNLRRDAVSNDNSGKRLPADGKDLPRVVLSATDLGFEWPRDTTMVAPQSELPTLTQATGAAVTVTGNNGAGGNGDSIARRGVPAGAPRAVEPGEVLRAAMSQRDLLPTVQMAPATPATAIPAEVRNLPLMPDRFYRAEAKLPASPGNATGVNIDGLESIVTGDDAETVDALVRRMAGNLDGNVRQQTARDGLAPKMTFELPAAAVTTAHADASPAPLTVAVASTDPLPRVVATPLAVENAAAATPGPISQPAQSSQAPATSLPRIDVPLQDPAWGDALNERVTFMSGKEIRNAEIRLNPAELGPIRVQLTVDDRGTSVSFTAHHAHTRDAIEQALPRLRELFSEQGLSLGQASVSDQGVRQDRDGQNADGGEWLVPDSEAEDAEVLAASRVGTRASNGLVDTFA